MKIKDRIKGLRRVKASQLKPSPMNWRLHPPAQQEALRGILAEVGYCDALIARQLKDGTLELIDGHLRAETTPDTKVPVLVVDLSDDEAAKVLATLDPLAAMAETDQARLAELLGDVKTNSEALNAMLSRMKGEQQEAEAPGEFKSFDETIETEHTCPKCGYRWSGATISRSPSGNGKDGKAAK